MEPGVTIDCYLPRLSVEEILDLNSWANRCYDKAPFLAGWLKELVFTEADRRDECSTYDEHLDGSLPDALLPKFPIDISNQDLADALVATTVISYSIRSPRVGAFVDSLTQTIVALAARRLRNA